MYEELGDSHNHRRVFNYIITPPMVLLLLAGTHPFLLPTRGSFTDAIKQPLTFLFSSVLLKPY